MSHAELGPVSHDGATSPSRWIHGPRADVALALLWVPFAAAAALCLGDAHRLQTVVATTLLVSLAHQPITLALVYGDPAQYRARRRIFTWSPLVFLAAVLIGRTVSLALVAGVAGVWNAVHTLLQRYGLVRIYGRKAGEGQRSDERPMLFSWLALAFVWAAADPRTPALLRRVNLGSNNERGVGLLLRHQVVAQVLLAPVVVVAVVLAARWYRRERAQLSPIGPKHLYLAATAALFATMLVSPIVGIVGYVGAHAVEYLVVVHGALGRRYTNAADGTGAEPGGVLGRAVRGRLGPTGVVVLYLAMEVALLKAVDRFGSAAVYATVFLTLGGLHVFYDGFIWKLRRPVVARSLAVH